MKRFLLGITLMAMMSVNAFAADSCMDYALDAATGIANLNEEADKINVSKILVANKLYLVEAASGSVKLKYTVQTQQVSGALCVVKNVTRL